MSALSIIFNTSVIKIYQPFVFICRAMFPVSYLLLQLNDFIFITTIMKKIYILLLLNCIGHVALSQSIGVGTNTPHSSAVLDISSTSKGLLVPRMSSLQRSQINSPLKGLLVFDNDTNGFWFYNGTSWQELSGGGEAAAVFASTNGTVHNTQNVGTDNFLFGKTTMPANGESLTESVFYFNTAKRAFRAGRLFESAYGSPDSTGTNSIAMGFNPKASGSTSIAMGYHSRAEGNSSVAMGYGPIASKDYGTSMGYLTRATGTASFAAGNSTYASGNNSLAIGFLDTASGYTSAAFGQSTRASGQNSFTANYQTKATADNSTAMGYLSSANGVASLAVGSGAKTFGFGSFAAGVSTEAMEYASTALGYNNKAEAVYSLAAGVNNISKGVMSAVFGEGNISQSAYSFVVGRNNEIISNIDTLGWTPTDPIFIIGNGQYNSRSTALTVLKNGNTGMGVTSPSGKLHVRNNSNAGAGQLIVEEDFHSNDGARVSFRNTARTDKFWDLFGQTAAVNADANFNFWYNNFGNVLSLKGDGNIGIGVSLPTAKLHLSSGSGDWDRHIRLDKDDSPTGYAAMLYDGDLKFRTFDPASSVVFRNSFNHTTATLSPTGYLTIMGYLNQNSDARLKKNITGISESLNKIISLHGYHYNWIDTARGSRLQTGFLAQEVEKIMPELVSENEEGTKSVNYSGMIPYMLEAIKELKAEIELLKKKPNN